MLAGLALVGLLGLGVHTWRLRQEVYYQEQYLPLYPWMSMPHQLLAEGLEAVTSWPEQQARRQELQQLLDRQQFAPAPWMAASGSWSNS